MTLTGTRIDSYQYELVKSQVFELFCTTKTGLADPRLRNSVQGQHRGYRNSRNTGGRSFAILDSGDYDGQFGYWVQDEDTLEEGFIAEDDEEDVFWQVDENEAFVARRFKRRRNCGVQAMAEEKVKAEDVDALSPAGRPKFQLLWQRKRKRKEQMEGRKRRCRLC